jgi:hypothetical protein
MMPTQEQTGVRPLESDYEFSESRLEATGFIFHGNIPSPTDKKTAIKANCNLLHFARCPKLEKVGDQQTKIWFRSIKLAVSHLNEALGSQRWKWCKLCEREVTQRILDEI